MTWGAVAVTIEGETPPGAIIGPSRVSVGGEAPSRPSRVEAAEVIGGAAVGGGIGTPLIAGGLSILGGILGGESGAQAQREANLANERLSLVGINEQRRQFEARTGGLSESRRTREDEINRAIQERFAGRAEGFQPFTEAGQQAVTQRSALLGLSGAESQQEAFSRFAESPGQTFLRERQERALLRNAAALGGLGGGNVRTALQEQAFGRAQTDLDQQLARLTGVAREGLTATQAGLREPGRVSTGVDVGVRSGPAAAPLVAQQAGTPRKGFFADIISGGRLERDVKGIGSGLESGGREIKKFLGL